MDPTVPNFSEERFLCERVAARYGLTFVVYDSLGALEEVHCGVREVRDATGPELEMWRFIVPADLRALVDRVRLGAPEPLPATPEEVYSSVVSRDYIYLNAEDFARLRGLPCFAPSFARPLLLDGVMGTVHGRWKACVSRLIPQGSFHGSPLPVPALIPLRSSGPRVVREPLDPVDLLHVDLEPLKVRRIDLRGMMLPPEKIA